MSDEGFDVIDSIEIGDLNEVKEQRFVLPPLSNLRVRVKKVKAAMNKDQDTATLNISFQVVDGVPVTNSETGETEMKYADMLIPQFPQRITYWVHPDKVKLKVETAKKETTRQWWKTQQYMVEFKQLISACGIDPSLNDYRKSDRRIDMDSLVQTLIGCELLCNVIKKEDQARDPQTGEYKGVGTYQNQLSSFRRAQ